MKWIKDRFPLVIIWAYLILTYIGLVALNGPYSQYKYESRINNYTAEQSQSGKVAPSIVAKVIQTPPTNQRRDKPDWQTEDHKAQIQMMRAAWVAVGLTVVGLIMIGYTLHYTRKASTSASNSLDVARQATKAEFQPYLSFSDLGLAVDSGADEESIATQAPFDDRDGFVSFLLTIQYSNWGKTPAENIRFEGAVLIRALINDEVILHGNVLEPFIDLKDYLISSDGDVEYIFTIKAPSKNTMPYDATHMDLLMKRIKVTLNVFFNDQFSAEERHYVCVWDGFCHDNKILRTSVKEIKQT